MQIELLHFLGICVKKKNKNQKNALTLIIYFSPTMAELVETAKLQT